MHRRGVQAFSKVASVRSVDKTAAAKRLTEPAHLCAVADGETEWDQIVYEHGRARNERAPPDRHTLVHARVA